MRNLIRIEAPDALRGFLLLQELPPVAARVEMTGGRCAVEIDPQGSDVGALASGLLQAVRAWLRDADLEETTLHVGPTPLRITA